jgi:hypothetical protein
LRVRTGKNLDLLAPFGRAWFRLTAVGLKIRHQAGRTRLAPRPKWSRAGLPHLFDLVVFDVLSLETPVERQAVAEMYRMTKPGGHVVVNVAAMESLAGNHSVLSHEVRRYSRSSLSTLLTNQGFVIKRITYTNAVLFPPMALARAIQRWRPLRRSDASRTSASRRRR